MGLQWANSRFAGGIFSNKEKAEGWISKHKLTGILTLYPLDKGVYEWAIENNFFVIKNEREEKVEFIQTFTYASQLHFHYENVMLD